MPNDNTPDLLNEAPVAPSEPPLGTLVTKDGRVVRLFLSERAELTIEIEGRGNPLRFDRYQTGAAMQLFAEHA